MHEVGCLAIKMFCTGAQNQAYQYGTIIACFYYRFIHHYVSY